MNWTDKQLDVINSENRSLLVSAAAGSGKTAVLVEHIVRKLTGENPVDADRLLVVTFTKAAAEEMRGRIGKRIDEIIAERPGDRNLTRQRALLAHAHISTIDSFCMWVVKSHFNELDMDPDFRIAEEGEQKLLRGDVLESLFEREYEKGDEDFFSLVDSYGGEKTDADLKSAVERLYLFSRNSDKPEEWFSFCRKQFDGKRLSDIPACKKAFEDIKAVLAEMKSLCDDTAGELDLVGSKLANTFYSDGELMEQGLACTDFETLLAWLSGVKFATKARKQSEPPEIEIQASNLRDLIKDVVKNDIKGKLCYDTPDNLFAAIKLLKSPINKLIDLTEEFGRLYTEEKKSRNIVDFTDVEHLALRLVREGGAGAGALSEKFDEIIIDEYQDSNLIQEELLGGISGELRGIYNRFMVGDVKQSIYRFRKARPDIFIGRYNESVYEGGPRIKIDLSTNYRSRPQVLDCVNNVFNKLMGRSLGGIEYDHTCALYNGREFPMGDSPEYGAELHLLQNNRSAEDGKTAEIRYIAGRIRELTDPKTGLKVTGEDGGLRPLQYRDIVILLRSMKGLAQPFAEGLNGEGIPAYCTQSTGYFDAPEVKLLLNLLKIIDNPRQDIPLMAVLVSPIGGVSDETVAGITAKFPKISLYDRLVKAAASGNYPEAESFMKRLSDYRDRAAFSPIYELLEYILTDTGYIYYAAALPGGEVRRANIEMLKEKALAFENTSYHGLFRFNRYIESLKKYEEDFGEANVRSEKDNLVRITSIHKSKGLEYPVVITAALGHGFNRMEARNTFIADEELGIAADAVDCEKSCRYKTLLKTLTADKITSEETAEELRVLYVAMTRAKEKLILVGTDKNSDATKNFIDTAGLFATGKLPSWYIKKAGSLLDWVRAARRADENCFPVYREPYVSEVLDGFSKNVTDYAGRSDDLRSGELSQYPAAEEILSKMRENIGFEYPFAEAARLSGTAGVSKIEKKLKKDAGNDTEPSGKAEKSKESEPCAPDDDGDDGEEGRLLKTDENGLLTVKSGGAGRGTAYHRVFQLLDPERAADPEYVRSFIKELTERGTVEKEYSGQISPGDIAALYASPLGERIIKAKKAGALFREKPFVMGISAREYGLGDCDETVLLQGIIDMYFREGEKIVLVDYKTDRLRDEKALIERHEIQLGLYRKALEKGTGLKVAETYIYSTTLGKPILLEDKHD